MRAIKLLIIILLIMWGNNSFADSPTFISSDITENTVWTTAGSPYVIMTGIKVNDAVTLTIQPGVIVKFNYGDVHLEVQGGLIAMGTEQDSIIFTSYRDDSHGGDTNGDGYATTPDPGDWRRILFNYPDVGCVMDYCVIKYAGRYWNWNGQYIGLHLFGGFLTMSNSIISHTYGSNEAIKVQTSGSNIGNLTLINSKIIDNNYRGVWGNGILNITNCEIERNRNWGIYSTGDNCNFTDNTFKDNVEYGLYSSGVNCVLTNNISQNHTVAGIYCSGQGSTMQNNQSINNPGFGFKVNVDLVDDVRTSNLSNLNGHLGAIGITGGTVSSDATWTDDRVYAVFGSWSISDATTLTLEPGTIIKFDVGNYYLEVQGTLVAEGTEADSIVFTSYKDDSFGGDTNDDGLSSQPARGDWQRILFNLPDVGSVMDYCVMKYAGRYWNWDRQYIGLHLLGGSLTMSNSIISHTYGSSEAIIVQTSGSNIGNLTLIKSKIIDNNYRGIWSNGILNITNCEIKRNGNCGIYSTGDNCAFTDNTFNDNVEYGLYSSGVNCVLTNNISQNHTVAGIYCSGQGSTIQNNRSINNPGFGFQVNADLVNDVWDANVDSANGHLGAIGITGGAVTSNANWTDEQVYVTFGSWIIGDGTTLSLEPGVILKFDVGNTYLEIKGTLVAEGTEADSIVFTSYKDDSFGGDTNDDGLSSQPAHGDWQRILFNLPDVGCVMDYCVIKYAGRYWSWNGRYIGLHLFGGSLTISNSIISETYGSNYEMDAIRVQTSGSTIGNLTLINSKVVDNHYNGIWSNGVLNIANCEISRNGNGGIYSTGNNCTFTNNTFNSNGEFGLYSSGTNCILSSNISQNHTIAGIYCAGQGSTIQDNQSINNTGFGFQVNADLVNDVWDANVDSANGHLGAIGITGGTVTSNANWTDEQVYVTFGSWIVGDGTTLSLEPGVILKFDVGNYYLEVQGTLVAEGTEADSIVFTSYKDDSFGGDTNDDGLSSQPAHGDWQRILFNLPDVGSVMDYCVMKYAGRHWNWNGQYVGLHLFGGSLTMSNSIISETYGSNYEMDAIRVQTCGSNIGNLTLINSKVVNNHYIGIWNNGVLNITNCEISRNGNCGIYSTGDNCTYINNKIYDNGETGLYHSAETADIQNNVIRDNKGFAVKIHPELIGEIISTCKIEENSHDNAICILGGNIANDDTWDSGYTLVVENNIKLNSGVTLLISPGTVLKFNGNYQLENQGTLIAQGSQTEKIVFSSYKDDAYGGDTNNDGVNSVPAPGDWRRLYFNGTSAQSVLGWVVISYAGYNNDEALYLNNCNLNLSECIVIHNKDRGIYVHSNATLNINNSDIYDNGYGLQNANIGYQVDARNCWWGYTSGPYHPTFNPDGQGNQVSDHVLFEPWLDRSIDNPWEIFPSPTSTGLFTDVAVIDINEDNLPDLVGTTENEGLKIYQRTDYQVWTEAQSPMATDDWFSVSIGDYNEDQHLDFVIGGINGIKCYINNVDFTWTESISPLSGITCHDVELCYLNRDLHLDLVVGLGENNGIKVFYGDGAGNWNEGNQPISTNTYRQICEADLNNDTYKDILASNAEFLGVNIWYGDSLGNWMSGPTIGNGHAFWGLATEDINKDGFFDVVVGGNVPAEGIQVYLNNGDSTWVESSSPTSTGIYKDIALIDMNGDRTLDLAASSQGSGIQTWLGTKSLYWNYWYHPATSGIYRGIDVKDFTIDNTIDVVAANFGNGISMWRNITTVKIDTVFAVDPQELNFGQILTGEKLTLPFQLTNASDDTVYNIVVYTTDTDFTAVLPSNYPKVFDLLPHESIEIQVTFSPQFAQKEREAVVIYSSVKVIYLPLMGEGVAHGVPQWTADLMVENAIGGSGNSQTLILGTGVGATDTLDVRYGEVNLPPIPISGEFDARFKIPGYEGFIKDIRDFEKPDHIFTIQWQAGSGGYPATVSWDITSLPIGTFYISDITGGTFIPATNMRSVSSIVVADSMNFINSLQISMTKHSEQMLSLEKGWNLISLTVDPPSRQLWDLIPTAISAFEFDYLYKLVEELEIGNGYWVEVPADTQVIINGVMLKDITIDMVKGWNLIGSIYDTLAVNQIIQQPEGSIISVFRFKNGYVLSDSIYPGDGHWVETKRTCSINLSSDQSLAKDVVADNNPVNEINYLIPIIITDAEGKQYWVEIGADSVATDSIDHNLGEYKMPPKPPVAATDIRLITGNSEINRDIRNLNNFTNNFILNIQPGDLVYPIRISWLLETIPNETFAIADNRQGIFFPEINMLEQNCLIISDSLKFVTQFVIKGMFEKLKENALPTQYVLHQNYPNPFNPHTTIRYDLPEEVDVRIDIYDILGRHIMSLVDKKQQAGWYRLDWNARNKFGQKVTSGLYFIRMQAGEFLSTKRMIVLK